MLTKNEAILSLAAIAYTAFIWNTAAYFEREKIDIKTSEPCPCLSLEFDTVKEDNVMNFLKHIPNMDKVEFQFVDKCLQQQSGKISSMPFDLKMDVVDTTQYYFEVQTMWDDPDKNGMPNISHIMVNVVPNGAGEGEFRNSYDTDHAISTRPLVFSNIFGVKRYLEAHAGAIGKEVPMDRTVDYATQQKLAL